MKLGRCQIKLKCVFMVNSGHCQEMKRKVSSLNEMSSIFVQLSKSIPHGEGNTA